MSLIKHLQTVRVRTQPDDSLGIVLLLVVMGKMSGCTGYRPLADFEAQHQTELVTALNLPEHRLPSRSTLRRLMIRVPFESFLQAFNAWAQEQFMPAPEERLATSLKRVSATMTSRIKILLASCWHSVSLKESW